MLMCPQCAQPLRALRLTAHYERQVEIEHCAACRLVWFDPGESMRIDAPGWIGLLRQLADREAAIHPWHGQPLACPRCRQALLPQHDRTRYGRFIVQACPVGHGSVQSLAALLARRGLVRAPTPAERAAMQTEPLAWACLNCGAPWPPGAAECSHCATPALLLDLVRLADSLRPQAASRDTASEGRWATWACHACGQPLDPTRQVACPHCRHPVMAAAVADLEPLLAALAAAWQEPRR